MKRTLLLLFALFLLLSGRCFASRGASPTDSVHECPRLDARASCTLRPGDTLSGVVHAYTGSWTRYGKQFLNDNPELKSHPNFVLVGTRVFFTNLQRVHEMKVAARRARPHKKVMTLAAAAAMPSQFAHADRAAAGTDIAPSPVMIDLPADGTAQAIFAGWNPSVTVTLVSPVMVASASRTAKPHRHPRAHRAHRKKKATVYTYVANGNLHGNAETQLLLFDNIDEQQRVLPANRIELKDSWAAPSANGKTTIFIRLQQLPTKPFSILVAGVNRPIDGDTLTPYAGKFPKHHHVLRTIGITAGTVGMSLLLSGGNPIFAGATVGTHQVFNLIARHRENVADRKALMHQRTIDKANLAYYRAKVRVQETQAKLLKFSAQEVQ